MLGGHGGRNGRVTPLDEASQSPLERGALDQDVPLACSAAQADVGAEPVDEPRVAATRMPPTQADDVTEQQVEDGTVRHGGQGIRGADGRDSGPAGAR